MSQLKSRTFRICIAINTNSLEKIAMRKEPIPAKDIDQIDNDLTESYASRLFSEIAVLDLSNIINAQATADMTKEERAAFEKAQTEAMNSIACNGLKTRDGNEWVILASTPSEKKQSKMIIVHKDEQFNLHNDLGLTDELLNGTSYAKCEDKLIPNCFSGQHEGSIAAAGLGMKNIFILASRCKGTFFRHAVEAKNLQNLSQTGEIEGRVHDGTLENKVGDANGMIIREALPAYRNAFIDIAQKLDHDAAEEMLLGNVVEAIKVAYWHGTLDRINEKIHKDAKMGKLDLYWTEQVRGKGLKATITDAPIVKWAIEGNINALDGFFGEVKTIAQLIRENQIVFVTEDCLKAKALWTKAGAPKDASAWNAWIQKGYEKIWVCDNGHISCIAKEMKTSVMTSRQHLAAITFAEEEEKQQIAQRAKERLDETEQNGTEETKVLAKIFGDEIKSSVAANYLDTNDMIAQRNFAEQGKVAVNGTWAMIVWDLKPMLAVAAHLEDEAERPELIRKARTIFGDTVTLNNCKSKVGATGRFPSLGMNLIFVRICKNYDLCDNTMVMSWDIKANDIQKADTDGDHEIIYLPESAEEADEIEAFINEHEGE